MTKVFSRLHHHYWSLVSRQGLLTKQSWLSYHPAQFYRRKHSSPSSNHLSKCEPEAKNRNLTTINISVLASYDFLSYAKIGSLSIFRSNKSVIDFCTRLNVSHSRIIVINEKNMVSAQIMTKNISVEFKQASPSSESPLLNSHNQNFEINNGLTVELVCIVGNQLSFRPRQERKFVIWSYQVGLLRRTWLSCSLVKHLHQWLIESWRLADRWLKS